MSSFGVKSKRFCESIYLGSSGCVRLSFSEGNGFVQELVFIFRM